MHEELLEQFIKMSLGILGKNPQKISEGLYKIGKPHQIGQHGYQPRFLYSRRRSKIMFRSGGTDTTIDLTLYFSDVCNPFFPTGEEIMLFELTHGKAYPLAFLGATQ